MSKVIPWEERYDPEGYTRGAPRTKDAAMQAEIDELRKSNKSNLVGWVILDCNASVFHMIPKSKSFFGQIIENSAPSQEYIQHLERDWTGLTPFTVKEIYT